MFPNRLWLKLKKQDWLGFILEMIIVVLGILIAYQLTVANDQRAEKEQIKTLIFNLKLENEKNLEEFEELRDYRNSTVKWTTGFFHFLHRDSVYSTDSLRFYIIKIFRISTPDLQQQNLITYINSVHSMDDLHLKTNAIRLKSLYDEWVLNSNEFRELKQTYFFDYIADAVDFHTGNIVNKEKLEQLIFKNKMRRFMNGEQEQHRLYLEALEQLKELQASIAVFLE